MRRRPTLCGVTHPAGPPESVRLESLTREVRMNRLGFGVQVFPYHRTDHHPAVQLEEDLILIEHLERYNFDEVWVGEHHSTGWQNIASPELILAAASERTGRIKLGTGVT